MTCSFYIYIYILYIYIIYIHYIYILYIYIYTYIYIYIYVYIFAELTNNLFGVAFKRNPSDLCKQLFLLKIAN